MSVWVMLSVHTVFFPLSREDGLSEAWKSSLLPSFSHHFPPPKVPPLTFIGSFVLMFQTHHSNGLTQNCHESLFKSITVFFEPGVNGKVVRD